MPDFSMCSKTLCPSKEKCLRYTATPNSFRQVYTEYSLPAEADRCDSFTDNALSDSAVKGLEFDLAHSDKKN
jgi:hypothetical protein